MRPRLPSWMRSSSAMPAADVALGDRHDETQVRFGELAAGELTVALHRLRDSRAALVGEGSPPRSSSFSVASSPASMRLASVTSCSAVSSGTLPISLRYMRTGSKLPPSVCVTPSGRAALRRARFLFVLGRRTTGRTGTARRRGPVLAGLADASARGAGSAGAGPHPPRRWSSSSSSAAISSSTFMPRDSNMS